MTSSDNGSAAETQDQLGADQPGQHEPRSPAEQEVVRLLGWVGLRLEDSDGRSVGTVEAVFVDRESGSPQWLLISRHRLLVPLAGAQGSAGRVSVPYTRARIQSGPRTITVGLLTARTERALCEHYGLAPTRGSRLSPWERRATSSRARLVTGRANWLNRVTWEPGPRAVEDRRGSDDRRASIRAAPRERRSER